MPQKIEGNILQGFACQQIAEHLWLVGDTKQIGLKTFAISVILAMCLKLLMLDAG